MNRGKSPQGVRAGGYTIVETLIFLAVSAVIFFSAITLIGGRQNKAQFVSAVRDFETKLTDIANDVATGYYQGGTPFHCDAPGGVFNFSGTAQGQGTKVDCIFVGTVLKFGNGPSDDDHSKFTQFTLAGLRADNSGINVTKLSDAKPQIVPGLPGDNLITYGANVYCIRVGDATQPCNGNNAAIGFLTKFTGVSPSGGNGIQTDVLSYATSLNNPATTSVTDINNPANYSSPTLNPKDGITICLKSGGTSQYALIHIGSSANSLTIGSEIKNYSGATPPCV